MQNISLLGAMPADTKPVSQFVYIQGIVMISKHSYANTYYAMHYEHFCSCMSNLISSTNTCLSPRYFLHYAHKGILT